MALRLDKYVVYGEIRNTYHYSTSGFIALRGEAEGHETIVRLALTGDCCPDTSGKHICFWPSEADDRPDLVFRVGEHEQLQLEQIGPTGTITVSGWARTMPCPPEEFMRRKELGEPPPTEWKRRLYIEWYGQNGRIVVELADPLVQERVREPSGQGDEGEWVELPNSAPLPSGDEHTSAGPIFTILNREGGEVHTEHWVPRSNSPEREESGEGLIPDTLQEAFDAQADAVDRAIRGEDEGDGEALHDMELMDYCIEHGDGEPISDFLGDLAQFPRPEGLDDETVESHLKVLLARLAAINHTVDVCPHLTPRDCYRVLLDEILPECTAYEELIGTSCVAHLTTYEYCPACEAEFGDSAADAAGQGGPA